MSQDAAITRRATLIVAATAAWWSPLRRAQAADAPKELRIGFQKGSVNLVFLKLRGTLEKRLPSTRVSWVEFPAGPQLLEALAVGSVDFGATGDSPPVFAQAAGKDLVYVGAEPPKPDASAILVKPDSPIRTLTDLKGRKLAFQRGSSAHFLTVRALEKAGIAWSDFTPVALAPAEARAAFERGSVDAWAIWDPYFAAAEIAGNTRILVTSRGLTNNNTVYLASPAFASQPAVLKALFETITEAEAWSRTNRKEAAQQVADFTGLNLSTVHRFLERRPAAPVGPITAQIVAEQQRVADAFHKLQLIPKPIRVSDIVLKSPA
ncbi:aliphatic sulfonate ABC transporter substrate-binding protein [Piscinibacter terrae]|uniref:Putative aliphatic sulfonates-binding protein n=1 Tax=Piscinibacter terrae TaxID=2496871 RepID=A0A3N7HN48_9BURK|nr:aliphatic sulfonate ABC transporter substrate-binding protein [Albitalea terrae]RQP23607.1 aliphatic sulfonate ABC transporter substrate-binding protein [Albitalea terrae]